MTANTTPAEQEILHTRAALPARTIASEWMRSSGYRATNARFIESLRAALTLDAVSIEALQTNKELTELHARMDSRVSDYTNICREIEAEILGYAIEARTDEETRALFVSVIVGMTDAATA